MELPYNKLICGDCIATMQRWPSHSIDLMVTSPPYNVGIKYDIYNDKRPYQEYLDWCRRWLIEILRLLKDDGRFCLNHYLSCGSAKFRSSPLMDLNTIAQKVGFKHHGLAVWEDRTLPKRTAWGSWLSASAPYIYSPYEGILILYKNRWKKLQKGISTIEPEEFMEACSGVWKIQPVTRKTGHPADFPIKLPSRCIKLFSYENDIVLDPFAGSGTTCLAAKQLNRRYIGIELSPSYYQIAEERLK